MPTKSEIWKRIDAYTGTASANVRTYAIAGLGVVWLFTGLSSGDLANVRQVPLLFAISGGLFAVALLLDVLHYAVGGYAYRRWLLQPAQKAIAPETELEIPPRARAWPLSFYYAKLGTTATGYLLFELEVFSLSR